MSIIFRLFIEYLQIDLQLLVRRLREVLQQGVDRHDHARGAEPALRPVRVSNSFLHLIHACSEKHILVMATTQKRETSPKLFYLVLPMPSMVVTAAPCKLHTGVRHALTV